jgi:hypothetical protein
MFIAVPPIADFQGDVFVFASRSGSKMADNIRGVS